MAMRYFAKQESRQVEAAKTAAFALEQAAKMCKKLAKLDTAEIAEYLRRKVEAEKARAGKPFTYEKELEMRAEWATLSDIRKALIDILFIIRSQLNESRFDEDTKIVLRKYCREIQEQLKAITLVATEATKELT